MSGPKVVRIVTREEIIAICQGHLHRLEKAVARWEAQGLKIGELSDSECVATRARRDQLSQLLADDQLLELQKRVPIEIEFLSRDMTQREELAVNKAINLRQQQRNLQESAATLVKALEGKNAAPALLDQLHAVGAGKLVGQAQALLAQGFALLNAAPQTEQLTERQRQLAQQLKTGEPVVQFSQWLADQTRKAVRDPRLERIDQHIARLQTLDGPAIAAPFLLQLSRLETETRENPRNLLLDSLVLDLAQATLAQQQRRQAFEQLQLLAAEVETLSTAGSAELLNQVVASETTMDLATLAQLTEQCQAQIALELRQRAALARRQAVLEGLGSLGYEVREGMATAWANEGRVVLRKTATPGVGVEVGGNAESGRLQVRAVALGADHDARRDRDIETIWCGEFQRLQALLASRGDDLSIERALAVGEVPLKVVALDAALVQREVAQRRTL
ncbi:hypothetical protein GNF76_08390 [Pseudomonas sp. CCM 7893]|uniref:Uncharacterized protein n=1 Tax=Pseudomonas spelaei TaxID=1055469 RepID=A0A6I3WAX2_9PSED|nr:hypothetical protein [Pseudomonas spelaei]MUF04352.1 hypothetical protein [Pseudomonas spelaei]